MEKTLNDIIDIARGYENELTKENANKCAEVFPTRRDLIAGAISKLLAKDVVPSHVLAAHHSGDIHYHDLDYAPAMPMTNCCLVDLREMFRGGFKLGTAQIESPKSIGVAAAVMCQIVAQVASHQYGGTTIANIDQVLAPYVTKSYEKHVQDALKYDIRIPSSYAREKTEKDVMDAMQSAEYEVNTMFSSNGQSPFITFTFGMGTSWEERLIQKAILKNRIRGLGRDGITPVFPKLVMFLEEGINMKPSDPNYDIKQLAIECSTKRIYPDFISAKNNRIITGSSVPVSPMGCRSYLGKWVNEDGEEVLDGRNNLGVVSLNLPRIALMVKHDNPNADTDTLKKAFMKELETRMPLCFDALMSRIQSLEGVKASVAPVLYQEGAFGMRLGQDDTFLEKLANGRSSVSLGYIGLHEVLIMLFGVHPFDSKDAQIFGKHIVKALREQTDKWKHQTGWGFSLYSTPAESLCYRFNKLDREIFGVVKGVTDKDWYTNSFHLDVDRKVTPFEKIDFEKDYHFIVGGGQISYVELPSMIHNCEAVETIIDYAVDNLMYFGINLGVDTCFCCDSTKELKATANGFECTHCGNIDQTKMNVIRRTCGYLGAANSRPFNKGKQHEMMNRVKHI